MTRASLHENVILANVARNNAYPIAEALASAGYLRKFVTSVYYKPDEPLSRLLHWTAGKVSEREVKRVEGRRAAGIPDDRVATVPLPEIVEEAALQAGRRLGFDARPVTYLKNEVFDWVVARRHVEPCAIFHGFEQCALFSFRKAKALGATTVLDQPLIHRATLDRIEREERARLGVPAPADTPLLFDHHIERKYEEHALTDFVIGGLDFVKKSMVDNGFPADRVFTVPYGADTGAFKPIDRPPREGFEILYAGPLNFWKGLAYLLDAVEGLDDIPGVRLTIVGRSDPDWAPYFMPRIEALGERARYVGTVPQADMGRFYADADVLAFPSLIGGLGIVCFEAMATGLPVVTSDGDVILTDGVDGTVVPARDVEGWRRAFRRLAADRGLRLRLGAAGADRLQAFTWEAYRAGILRAYEEIAERIGK